MMNEETKASLNRFLKQREERIKNMTLAEARDIVGSIYGHSDMRMESDKALQMLLDCADKTLDQQSCKDKGEISDGYHTFNQLYHQRAILFATIVNQNKDKAWKSFKHSDGHYCFDEDGEMFIVGIDTPKGSYTYHYHKKYWDYFNCKELECGKVWDGHTEEDATRLLSLGQQPSFINKPCVSEGVCREDKIQVLDKIKAEIERKAHSGQWSDATMYGMLKTVAIIDKYRSESEE